MAGFAPLGATPVTPGDFIASLAVGGSALRRSISDGAIGWCRTNLGPSVCVSLTVYLAPYPIVVRIRHVAAPWLYSPITAWSGAAPRSLILRQASSSGVADSPEVGLDSRVPGVSIR